MKYKGFTLIEFLATMVIIGILSVTVIRIVDNMLTNNEMKLCESQLQNIKSAAMLWASENKIYLPTTENEKIYEINNLLSNNFDVNDEYGKLVLSIKFLKEQGYINEKCEEDEDGKRCFADVYNARINHEIEEDTEIVISKKGKGFTYNIGYSCTD